MLSLILGLWLWTGLVYQGHELPPPNPALKIWFTFEADGTNTLHYYREGEPGFCERRALYSFDGAYLTQQIIWVHPQNADFCGQDVDMQLGRESRTRIEVESNKLKLHLHLGDEDLIHVWTRQL